MTTTTNAYQLSTQQQAVIDFVKNGKGSLNLVAFAGTGKTSTLMEVAKAIKGSAFMGAFNKAIAEEFKQRLSAQRSFHVTGGTIHSAGMSAWLKTSPHARVEGRKVQTIAKGLYAWDRKLVNAVTDTVSYAKQACLGVNVPYTEPSLWQAIIDYFDIQEDIPAGISCERFIDRCVEVYKESLAQCEAVIDFDDMLLAPLYFKSPIKKYDWVLIDEAQDTNTARRLIAFAMMHENSRLIACGDPFQCQPGHTMVTLEGGAQRPIEEVRVGDKVACFDRRAHMFTGTSALGAGRRINAVKSRKYAGRLLTVKGGGLSTQITPNHKFLVRWTDRTTDACVTYVMRRGGYFRVGWCQLFSRGEGYGSLHVAMRARLEDADEAWIVSIHEARSEASMHESMLSLEYQLPLPQFREHANANHYTQEFLDRFWEKASQVVDMKDNAARLLAAHGRDIAFPFWSKATWKKQGRTTVFETQACNILPGYMAIPLYNSDVRKADWIPVDVSEEEFTGNVYSLDVDFHHNYIADGILTCNSIYGFAGADSDSMDIIKRELKSEELPLSVTYRCPKEIVKVAQEWVPDFTAAPSAANGLVTHINVEAFWKQSFSWNDAIICRNSRPLIGTARRLREMGIPCVVEGMSSKGLIALATKWGEDISIEAFSEYLDLYEQQECKKWAAKGNEEKAEAVSERCNILRDFADRLDTSDHVSDLVRKINFLLGDSGNVNVLRLCTIHKSKGREWNRVYLVGRNRYQPSQWAKKDWELKQEQNLMYVAVTRAKVELVEVEVPWKQKNELEWWEV